MKRILFLLPLILALIVSTNVEAKKKKYPNGDFYEGEWKKGTPNGIGKMTYANGDTYEGQWEFGEITGQGKMVKNGEIYQGSLLIGVPNGNGTIKYLSGAIYEGNWENGKYSGSGVYTDTDGNIFKGEFNNNSISIVGKLTFSNGDFCEGEFTVNDTLLHLSSCIFENGICSKKVKGETFIGEIENRKYKKGKLTYNNGEWLEGEWENGEFYNGTGCVSIDANKYEGKWIKGVFTGHCQLKNCTTSILSFSGEKNIDGCYKGIMKSVDGVTYDGELDSDFKKQGEGTLVTEHNKVHLKAVWKDDHLLSGVGTFVIDYVTYDFNIKEPVSGKEDMRTIVISSNDTDIDSGEISKRLADRELPNELVRIYNQREARIRSEFYNKYLKEILFTIEIPLSELMPELTLIFDIHSLQVKIAIGFENEESLAYAQKTYIDRDKIRNYDQGYLIQQKMLSEKYTTELKMYKYKIEDGYLIFEDKKYEFNANNQELYDEQHKITLIKQNIK